MANPRGIDETGNRYGKWVVLKRLDNPKKNGALFLCQCDCGRQQEILGKRLRNGETRQCTSCQAAAHIKNLAGKKFNLLTVLDEHESRDGITYWHCVCECGNDTWVSNGNLQTGAVKSCGCLSHVYHGKDLEDLTGKTFNDLTVIGLDRIEGGRRYWKCECVCGNSATVVTSDLTAGKIKSCGCRKKKVIAGGTRFGKLVVLNDTGEVASNGANIYLCQCDCGKLHKVVGTRLRDGSIKSCGCGRFLSYNEESIAKALELAKIPFVREKSFEDLPSTNGRPFSFDFFVDNTYCIEFDGSQHFRYKGSGWDTKEHLEKTRQRDTIKNEYCFSHHIPLIRIPFDAEYTIDDLRLETSRFILTPENTSQYYQIRA